jgi:hypothetical protein
MVFRDEAWVPESFVLVPWPAGDPLRSWAWVMVGLSTKIGTKKQFARRLAVKKRRA